MTEYMVSWQIFVEARTPEEAALAALAAQRNPESAATCFEVLDDSGRRSTVVCPMGEEPMSLAESAGRPYLSLVKTAR